MSHIARTYLFTHNRPSRSRSEEWVSDRTIYADVELCCLNQPIGDRAP
jgi:hypothetical protein